MALRPPASPAGLPSELLEHRPDIAGAERRAAAANADIGVAKAAYFPQLTLNASGGFAAAALGSLFDTPGRVWSLGASLAQTLFDGGLRRARRAQAEAAYDITVAQYKQTVLGAFQQVEDELALLRVLDQETVLQDQAVRSSKQAEQPRDQPVPRRHRQLPQRGDGADAVAHQPAYRRAAARPPARRQHLARRGHRRRLERRRPPRRRLPRSRNDPRPAMTTTFSRHRTTWALVAIAVAVLGRGPLVRRAPGPGRRRRQGQAKRPADGPVGVVTALAKAQDVPIFRSGIGTVAPNTRSP